MSILSFTSHHNTMRHTLLMCPFHIHENRSLENVSIVSKDSHSQAMVRKEGSSDYTAYAFNDYAVLSFQ